MRPETRLKLSKFVPRPYQLPLIEAVEQKGFRKALVVMPRRAGKDITAWNIMIRAAIKTVGIYFYCLPTFRQARLVIWDSITNSGERFLDYIPKELIEKINSQEMKITLVNGSIIQLIGSDTYDTSLVGTNPRMIVFSEYALADSRAYTLAARPILNANEGTAIIVSTPRGKNSLWELYNIAQNSKEWFCQKLTLDDTQHVSKTDIEREIASGEISRDLVEQEYYCSFTVGHEGSYYAKYIDKMRLNGQIGIVPWEASFKVHTAWDLGVRDSTSIIFFQTIGQTVRIIDCYEKNKEGLEHYVKVLESKPYSYGKHIFPHDIRVMELGSGITRIEKLRQLGIKVTIAEDHEVMDGIESVRSAFSKTWIDEKLGAPLIKALENYRQEYDSKRNIYKMTPLHDQYSHFADAMRYLAVSLPKTRDGMSAEDLDKLYRETVYGTEDKLPPIFQDNRYRT